MKNKSTKPIIKGLNNIKINQNNNYFERTPGQNKLNFIQNKENNNNRLNNELKNNMNINNKDHDVTESIESSLSSKIYEKNIKMLNLRIKEQENNIKYLNDRLKNYDMTMEQITNLNIEINKLNDVIRNKNNTIQEFRDIADMSKRKIEELIKQQNELNEKINALEEENSKLKHMKGVYKNGGDNINENYFKNYDKKDLKKLMEENNELKNVINEKNKEIKYLNNVIDKLRNNKIDENYNNYVNYDYIDYKKNNNINEFKNIFNKTQKYLNEGNNRILNWKRVHPFSKKNYSIYERSHTPLTGNHNLDISDIKPRKRYHMIDYSFMTEPNNIKNMTISRSKKYNNYLKKKYNVEQGLEYSNYLLDNLADSISRKCHNYIK
jgi:DNA repair exonuclease SbcCD ATPase subunit